MTGEVNTPSGAKSEEAVADSPVGGDPSDQVDLVPVDLARGIGVIRDHARHLPGAPGVYRMIDRNGDPIYVGKARHLKRRVTQYTQVAKLPFRLQRMVAETVDMAFTRTHTEVEALLLESNLIKRHRPRFNILLRDDKSFPYILITADHGYPQITKHRGARARDGGYYGPFASAGAVNRTITALQRAFLLRNCSDTVFQTRTRPCLQYQIKRCTAPCVGRVSAEDYATQVEEARAFLTGRSRDVQGRFATAMQAASDALEFETAARYRDRIRALTQIQQHQDVNVEGLEDADAIAAFQEGGQTAIQVFFFRSGRNYGNRAYFPSHDRALDIPEVLGAFVAQFYDNKPPPGLVLMSHAITDQALVAEALSLRAGSKVELAVPQRGDKRRLIDQAVANAKDALAQRMAESASQTRLLDGVAEVFGLGDRPQRIEVYDNSHSQGEAAVGAMIVAGPEGLRKNAYRKFNIKQADATRDDYAMMREVLGRRFQRALKEDPERTGDSWPDLVLIDGGQGQFNAAKEVLDDLGVDDIALASIAKGLDREGGRERFFVADRPSFLLPPRHPVLFFLQRLRDEAHRFAIGTHRARKEKSVARSPLDEIAGIGPSRRRALLHHFGSARAIARAGLTDLEAVEGISKTVARRIYDHFHETG